MRPYELCFGEQAARFLIQAVPSEKRRLASILEALKKTPSRKGELQEIDARGRINEVIVEGDWVITFWSDDAVCEIRVVALERADEGP